MASNRSGRQIWIAWIGVLALAVVVVALALLLEGRFNLDIQASTAGLDDAANQLTEIEVTNTTSNSANDTPVPITDTKQTEKTNTNTIELSYKLRFSDCDSGQQPALKSNQFNVDIDNKDYQGHLSGDTLTINTDLTTPPDVLSFTVTGYDQVLLESPLAASGNTTLELKKQDGRNGLCLDSSDIKRTDNLTLTIKLSVDGCPADYSINTNDIVLYPRGTKSYFDEISHLLYIPLNSLTTASNRQVEIFYQGYDGKINGIPSDTSSSKNLTLKLREGYRQIQCGNSSDDLGSYDGISKAIANQIKTIKQTYKTIQKYFTMSSLNSFALGGNNSIFISEAQWRLNQQMNRLSYLRNLANGYDLPANYSDYADPTQLISDDFQSIFNNSSNGYGNSNIYNPYTQQYTYDSSNPQMYSFGNDYSYMPDDFSSYSNNTLVSPYQAMSPKCVLAPTIANKVGTLLEKIPKVGSILNTIANIFGLSYMYKNCSGYASYNNNSNYGYNSYYDNNYSNGNYDNYGNNSYYDNNSSNNNRYYPYNNSYSPYNSVSNPGSSLSIILSGPLGNLKTQLGRLPLGSAEMNNIWRWYLDAKNNNQSNNNYSSNGYSCPTSSGNFACGQSTYMDSNRRQYCEWAMQQNCPNVSY